jgi:hypothetical protein
MRLKNSSNCSRELITEVIRFVKPPGVANFDIWVKRGPVHGRAYWAGDSRRSTRGQFKDRKGKRTCNTPYVVAYIPEHKDQQGKIYYRFVPVKGHGYLGITCYTKTEALVYILAHELRHLWQARIKRGHRVWGARGQFSERDCDAYAIQALRKWRRRTCATLGFANF